MKVALLESASEFLAMTEPLRASDPFRTNLLGSVAFSVAKGARTYEKYFWWVITDESGKVAGAAMRTAPHGMVLSPMPLSAARQLARVVGLHDTDLPEIAGPSSVVAEFIKLYRSVGLSEGKQPQEVGHHLLYALGTLRMPTVLGSIENAQREEFKRIYAWVIDFGNEVGILMPNPTESIEDGFNRNSWRFWRVDDEIVAMAGYASLVETPSGVVGRIGPVYTPPRHRRKGYAGFLTGALSQELIGLGARVMLYTDAKNPTSNGVYVRLGFELLDENKRFKFVDPEC